MLKRTREPARDGLGHERYMYLHKLGAGTYGDVFLAKDRSTGRRVAIKKFKIDEDDEDANDDGVPASALVSRLWSLFCNPIHLSSLSFVCRERLSH